MSIAQKTYILEAAEYSPKDIKYLLAEFPEMTASEFLDAIEYSCAAKKRSPKISDVTFQVREVELYKEF